MSEARKLWIVEVRREVQVVVLAEDEATDRASPTHSAIVSASSMSSVASLPRSSASSSLPIGWAEALPYIVLVLRALTLGRLREPGEPRSARALGLLLAAEVRARGLRVPDPATADLFGEAP